jgi:hypothetical protein
MERFLSLLAHNEWLFIQFRGRYSRTGRRSKEKTMMKPERENPTEMRRCEDSECGGGGVGVKGRRRA